MLMLVINERTMIGYLFEHEALIKQVDLLEKVPLLEDDKTTVVNLDEKDLLRYSEATANLKDCTNPYHYKRIVGKRSYYLEASDYFALAVQKIEDKNLSKIKGRAFKQKHTLLRKKYFFKLIA
ncbi:hypothetical protein A3715_10495 [Oleiphilus sp. HI0009]|nr:hypothetical protein A3715_10495 [Oleiphilus sp. HI0009]